MLYVCVCQVYVRQSVGLRENALLIKMKMMMMMIMMMVMMMLTGC